MVGHKLGEFSPTRSFHGHTPADKKAAEVAASLSVAKTTTKPTATTQSTATSKPKELKKK